jgi:hypothetical protein
MNVFLLVIYPGLTLLGSQYLILCNNGLDQFLVT